MVNEKLYGDDLTYQKKIGRGKANVVVIKCWPQIEAWVVFLFWAMHNRKIHSLVPNFYFILPVIINQPINLAKIRYVLRICYFNLQAMRTIYGRLIVFFGGINKQTKK